MKLHSNVETESDNAYKSQISELSALLNSLSKNASNTMLLMNNRSLNAICSLAAVIALGLTGCTSDSSTDASTSNSTAQSSGQTAQALAPISRDPEAVNGTTITLPLERELVFKPQDDAAGEWTAVVEDPTIAEFTPASSDGSASFNAGIHPIAEGTTIVELTSPAGETSSFELIVTAGNR